VYDPATGAVKYITDLRILAPNVRKNDNRLMNSIAKASSVVAPSSASVPFAGLPDADRLRRLLHEGFVAVKVVISNDHQNGSGEKFAYNTYTRFAALIADNGDVIRYVCIHNM
jgi:hypothetical protein